METSSATLFRTVLFLSSIFIFGCAHNGAYVMDETFDSEKTDNFVESRMGYPLYINNVSDIRKDKDSLGKLGLTDVSSIDIINWLKKAFVQRGYKLNSNIEDSTCVADIGLKLAYIRSSSTSKATNIVLATRINQTEEITHYRGMDTGMNWFTSESEITSS